MQPESDNEETDIQPTPSSQAESKKRGKFPD